MPAKESGQPAGPIVLSLSDLTGNMVRPWAEAGYDCWCIDLQHPADAPDELIGDGSGGGRIRRFRADLRYWLPPMATFTIVFALIAEFVKCATPSVSAVVAIPGGDAGMQHTTADPRGVVSLSDVDMLGQTLTTIAGFTTGVPSNSADQTTTLRARRRLGNSTLPLRAPSASAMAA